MHIAKKTLNTYYTICLILGLIIALSANVLAQDFTDSPMPTSTNAQSEISIAINPNNPQNILLCCINGTGGAIDRYYTFDGGSTWTGIDYNPNGSTAYDDPTALFDVNGNGYCVYKSTDNNAYVQKTTNGGLNWGTQINTRTDSYNYLLDKPHAMADLSGTRPNNIYVAFTLIKADTSLQKSWESNIFLADSTYICQIYRLQSEAPSTFPKLANSLTTHVQKICNFVVIIV
jgi:hypothetical protein